MIDFKFCRKIISRCKCRIIYRYIHDEFGKDDIWYNVMSFNCLKCNQTVLSTWKPCDKPEEHQKSDSFVYLKSVKNILNQYKDKLYLYDYEISEIPTLNIIRVKFYDKDTHKILSYIDIKSQDIINSKFETNLKHLFERTIEKIKPSNFTEFFGGGK